MEHLPFFPKYENQVICQDKLLITWFEADFSQGRYNFEKKNEMSTSCTIITILLATYCNKEDIQLFGPNKKPNQLFICALGRAMLDGNSIHKNLKMQRLLPHVNLTLPEAIKCAGKKVNGIKEWKSVVFMQSLLTSLHINMQKHVDEWKEACGKKTYNLYVVLICESRSVLFIFHNRLNTVTLVDSHQHSTAKGACAGTVNQAHLRCLCTWFNHIMLKYNHTSSNLYELSFLYFKKKKK